MSYPQPTYTHPIPPPQYHQPPYTPITIPTYQPRPECAYPNYTYNSSPYEPPYLQYSEEPKPPGVTSLSESEDLGKTSVSSADQLWLKAWLKSQNISLNAKEETKPEDKSLLETRKKTFKCVQLHNELKKKTIELEVSEISTEEWEHKKQEIEELKSQIKETLHSLTNPKETERLKLKIAKRQRHKNWRKKHIKKLQTVRDERQRRRETLHKDIDEWRAEWLEKDTILKEEAARKFEADSKVEQVELKRNKHKDLTDLLKEIQKLRDLRRDKMKKEGIVIS
ncbi:hypothetical protein K7432_003753 [Basidiobolus ranarum]|uniref:Uncharacterized protein n=1 Tax=Basidiobolus ranarum TaxID=34480 RepID=A0ABR2WZ98_9FUNG